MATRLNRPHYHVLLRSDPATGMAWCEQRRGWHSRQAAREYGIRHVCTGDPKHVIVRQCYDADCAYKPELKE